MGALLALLIAVALLLASGRELYRLVGPVWLITQGRYEEARLLSTAVGQSPWRLLPSVKNAASYNVALCLHHEGRLEESLALLPKVSKGEADPNLVYSVESVRARSLVLLDRQPEEARAAITMAIRLRKSGADLVALAHASLSLGDVESAQVHFTEALSLPKKSGLAFGRKTLLFQGSVLQETMFDALVGWYLLRVGRVEEARAALLRAAASPLASVYRQRAEAILTRLRSGADLEEEMPSSLAPLVASRPG